jgi:hypothetical protein
VKTSNLIYSCIFWDITSCSPLKVGRRFGGTITYTFRGEEYAKGENRVQTGDTARTDCQLLSEADMGMSNAAV